MHCFRPRLEHGDGDVCGSCSVECFCTLLTVSAYLHFLAVDVDKSKWAMYCCHQAAVTHIVRLFAIAVWQQCLRCGLLLQFAERAVQSQPSKTDAEQRARHFKAKYTRRLQELKINPWWVPTVCFQVLWYCFQPWSIELAMDKSLWRLLVASGATHWHGACRIMMMMMIVSLLQFFRTHCRPS